MRTKLKSWQNKRHGWTRRVRWYEGPTHGTSAPFRLNFEDEEGSFNALYTVEEEAQAAYDQFRKTDVSAAVVAGWRNES